MKKTLLSIVALFAAATVNAQTTLTLHQGWNTELQAVLTGDVEFNYKNSYAAVNLITEPFNVADYPSYEVVVSEDTPVEKLQFCVNDAAWSGPFAAGQTTLKGFIPDGVETVEKILIQACNIPDVGKVEIISCDLIEKDGNRKPTCYEMPPSWAADVVTPITSGVIKYVNDKWGAVTCKGVEGKEVEKISLTTNAPIPAILINLVVTTSEKIMYKALPAGETTYTVDLTADCASGETIKEIALQYAGENPETELPLLLDVANVKAYVKGEGTSISSVNTDANAAVDAVYNLAGQRVADNAKGILIKNGKKIIR